MRIYIIGNDGVTLCRETPATVNEGEIAVVSNEELHTAPLSGKRLLALWNALPGIEKRRKVGDRDALIDQLWLAIEALPDPEPQLDAQRPSKQNEVIAVLRRPEGATDEVASATGWQRHTLRGVFSGTLKKKLADPCLGQRGTRPRLSHRRTGNRMKPAINNAPARQRSGGPSPIPDPIDNRPPRADLTEVERAIAALVDLSTQELRVGWRQWHRTGPPSDLSRDLLIRGIAHQLQERTYGGVGLALQRRLRILCPEFEKGASFPDSRIGLKTGTTLVRQWRGRAHTVLVREDGFEYEGQHYRLLTVIAEKITGAHWSGPRFFGLTRPVGASVAEATR